MEKDQTDVGNKKGLLYRWVIIFCSAAIMVLLDQWTKHLAVTYLKDHDPFVLIPGVLELRYLENSGAAFSMLQNQQWFFYILTAVFFVICILVIRKIPLKKMYRPLTACLTVLCAGAAGNLIDRIAHRYVVDFIYFSIIDFPIFNVADIYVTAGVIVLIVLVLFKYKDDDLKAVFSGRTK